MKTVYLTHPLHGVHLENDPEGVKRCVANGWTVYGENPPPVHCAMKEALERIQAHQAADAALDAKLDAPKPKRKYVRKAA